MCRRLRSYSSRGVDNRLVTLGDGRAIGGRIQGCHLVGTKEAHRAFKLYLRNCSHAWRTQGRTAVASRKYGLRNESTKGSLSLLHRPGSPSKIHLSQRNPLPPLVSPICCFTCETTLRARVGKPEDLVSVSETSSPPLCTPTPLLPFSCPVSAQQSPHATSCANVPWSILSLFHESLRDSKQ